jgi:hypothetical protein
MDEDCHISCPSLAPPQLLLCIDLWEILGNDTTQALAISPTPVAPQFGFSAILPIIYYHVDNSLHVSNGSVPHQENQEKT